MLVTVQDVARIYQCHEESVRRWVRAGKLRAVHVPGGMRIDLSSCAEVPKAVTDRLMAEWRAALDRAAEKAIAS